MKKIQLLSTVLCLMFLFGCSADDPKTTLEGNWKLRNITGGQTAIDDDFASGTITWKFEDDGVLTVTNNNTDETKETLLTSGEYGYEITTTFDPAETCDESMSIDNVDFGCYSLEGRRLKIGSTLNNGYLLTLER